MFSKYYLICDIFIYHLIGYRCGFFFFCEGFVGRGQSQHSVFSCSIIKSFILTINSYLKFKYLSLFDKKMVSVYCIVQRNLILSTENSFSFLCGLLFAQCSEAVLARCGNACLRITVLLSYKGFGVRVKSGIQGLL